MGWFRKLFGGRAAETTQQDSWYVRATFNDRLGPLLRMKLYGDPINAFLQRENLGEVSGGGTLQAATGEIEWCDVEIQLRGAHPDEAVIARVLEFISNLAAPHGSQLHIEHTDAYVDFGSLEGLALYLSGTDLAPTVYAESDINELIERLRDDVGHTTEVQRYWEGPEETALYFYGPSFELMRQQTSGTVAMHPLCEGARVVQIA